MLFYLQHQTADYCGHTVKSLFPVVNVEYLKGLSLTLLMCTQLGIMHTMKPINFADLHIILLEIILCQVLHELLFRPQELLELNKCKTERVVDR